MTVQTHVVVKFSIEGMHNWPDAPDRYSYLSKSHRHRFDFDCLIEEKGSRKIEINAASYDIKGDVILRMPWVNGMGCEFGGRSCEDLAVITATIIKARYETSYVSVTVFEDGIQGAGVTWTEEPDVVPSADHG